MMKNVLIKFLYVFALILSLNQGCNNKETMEFTDWPIIEAYLTPGNSFAINISRQVPFSEDVEYSSDNIDSLVVTVVYNDSVYQLGPGGEGVYSSNA